MPAEPKHESLLDVNGAAEILGISPLTLRNWVRDRQIEFIKVGRLVRFRRSTLDAFLEAGTVPKGGRHF